MSDARKIALFGGTFDPVHLGHLHMAELARTALDLDEVRFLPCRISPHKSGSPPTHPSDRLEMLRLATADLPWAVVDDSETRREGPSYSYETAEAMAARFPDARLFWIMGSDQWQALGEWRHPARLAKHVEFIVFARGNPITPIDGYVCHVVEGGHPASATEIRQALAKGATTHPWLPPPVAAWIEKHSLYRDPK